MAFYTRKSPRIPGYDYSSCNYYFVTICTYEHKCLFGSISQKSKCGEIAESHILQLANYYDGLDIIKFVVMPNHLHMIVSIGPGDHNPDLNQIIAQYKSGVSREIRKIFPDYKVWQRSYHDHVIRDKKGFEKIWTYIENNPLKWEEDCFYKNQE